MASHPQAFPTAGFGEGQKPVAAVTELTLNALSFVVAVETGGEDAELANNRVLASTAGQISITDGGAKSKLTLGFPNPVTSLSVTDAGLSVVDDADNTKVAKLDCSAVSAGNTRTFTFPDFDGRLVTEAGTQTLTNKTVTDNTFTFQDDVDNTKQFRFNLANFASGVIITATMPTYTSSSSRILIFADNTATMSNKTFGASNTFNLSDSLFKLGDNADLTKIAQFECSSIPTSTTNTYTFPAAGGTLITDQTVTTGTWSPTYSNQIGWTGTPVTDYARYTKVGDTVFCSITISGLTVSSSFSASHQVRITLPVARTSGNFTNFKGASGTTSIEYGTTEAEPCNAVFSSSGESKVYIQGNNPHTVSTACTVRAVFSYDAS